MRKRRVSLSLVILLLAALSTSAIGGCDSKNERERQEDTIRIAFFPNITHTQALIMKEKKLLEKKLGSQYKVEWLDFNAGPEEVEAMFAGEVDIGYIGPVPAITAYNQSEGDVRIIAGASSGASVLVTREGLDIDTVEELSGKTVAIPNLGNTQHLLLLKVLEEHGLKPKANGGTVNVVPVANADEATVMGMKQVDAALVPEPWGSTLQKQIHAEVLLDYQEMWLDGNYATTVVMVGKDFMEENPELVQQFIDVHKDATAYIHDFPEDTKQSVNSQIESLTGKSLNEEILDHAFSRMIVSEEMPEKSVMEYAKVNKEQGFIKKMPSGDIMDDQFLK